MNKYIIYTDGGSRGNPGMAGAGAYILDGNKKVLKEAMKFLGEATNNFAEYEAIILGLTELKKIVPQAKRKKVEIFINSDKKITEIIIRDDGPGFPKDLIDKHRLGEPYIRTADEAHISKYGLGLGTFIGKTLLEKNLANIYFSNSKKTGGAEVGIKWKNNDLIKI